MSALSHRKKGLHVRSYYTRAKVFGLMMLGVLVLAGVYRVYEYFFN